ncbi:hypothetical protein AHF37_11003 [Paragonimus kellicotti]|nr:hypothetical protein AHF37_11003 [Paragonimus kellicotti]
MKVGKSIYFITGTGKDEHLTTKNLVFPDLLPTLSFNVNKNLILKYGQSVTFEVAAGAIVDMFQN